MAKVGTKDMLVIGLTGGIGTGKSTVSAALAQRGAIVIDADKVGHEAYRPHTEIWEEIVAAFGRQILKEDEEVERGKLGAIVFSDPAALQRLNRIMHPRMARMMAQQIEGYRRQGVVVVVVLEAALLVEAGWTSLVDEVWVTTAPEAVVIRRLQQRNGVSEEQARARIRSQMPVADKEKHADVIVDTDCSLEEVDAKVEALWQQRTRKETLLPQQEGEGARWS